MRYRKKIIIITVLIAILTIIQYALPAHSRVVSLYDAFIFRPFQSLRNVVFSLVPFSVGDVLYLIGGGAVVAMLGKWLWYLTRMRTHKHQLGISLLHTVILTGSVYILFLLGWGGNYYKASLSSFWNLDRSGWDREQSLEEFDRFLVGKLNDYAPGYEARPFRKIDKAAQHYFRAYTDSRTRNYGVKAKPSVFGYFMQYFGVQGYYNPWTGEAQVNRYLPSFMLPFVVCHEMAHQAGIAAEDDANLLSYAIGTVTNDSVFHYSAYFNLWLYTHSRLKRLDTLKAGMLKRSLNPMTLAHLDTLRQIRKKYDSEIGNYSGALYDGYLKLHHQKDGIESYNKVTISAWALEKQRRAGSRPLIAIP